MPPTTSMQRPATPSEAIALARKALEQYEQSDVVRTWGTVATGAASIGQITVDQLATLNDQIGMAAFALASFSIQAASQIGVRNQQQAQGRH